MKTVKIITLGLLFLTIIGMPSGVEAQAGSQVSGGAQPGMSRAAQYYIGDMNELMMKVNVWGRVQKPGQYFVPSTTDLITLISVAGGPADKSRLDNVKIVRSSETGSEVIEVNIKKYLETGDPRLIPQLKPDDTIIVSGSVWYLAGQIVGVIAQFAIVANVYYWFFVRGAT